MLESAADKLMDARGSVRDRLASVIADFVGNIHETAISLEHSLTQDYGLDSIDLVSFWQRVEREFQIAIPFEDIEQFDRVRQWLDYLQPYVS